MNVETSANPVESSAELFVESETVQFYREPPPPYSAPETETQTAVTTQPGPKQETQVELKGILLAKPTFCQCYKCGHKGLTVVEYVNSNKTHVLAGCICGLTGWCCMCCLGAIPYFVKPCKQTLHHCSECKTYLGSHSYL